MFKFVALVALVASANAGVLPAATLLSSGLATPTLLSSPTVLSSGLATSSIAVGPALGAPLLGRTTVTAPETTIVKQQVVVDQPEIRYRAVPTIVQTAPIVQQVAAVKTIAAVPTVVQTAPIVQQVAAVKTIAAPTVVAPAPVAVAKTVVAPAPAVAVAKTLVAPAISAPAPVALSAPLAYSNTYLAAPAAVALQGNTLQTIATPWAASSQVIAGIGSQTLISSPTSTLLASPNLLALKK